jgi:hypothetical protein
MKRNVIAAVLGAAGLVGLATSSFGQGQIAFDTYSSVGYYPVTYGAAAQTALGLSGPSAGVNVDAELGYFVGALSANTVFTLIPSTISALNNVSGPESPGTGPNLTGFIRSGAVAGGIPGVTTAGAPVSFEILAWVASGAGAAGGTYNSVGGYSGSFKWQDTFNAANIGSTAGAGFFQDLTGNAVLNLVTPVPEPTTLALAGLGGAALLALRRKKA